MKYQTLHKWHIWLGWLVGIPLILWTASGLFMTAKPIDEIRGAHLRAERPAITPFTPVAPLLDGRAVARLSLEQRLSGPVWIIQYQDGGMRRADGATGALLPPVDAIQVLPLAQSYYSGTAKIMSVKHFTADETPMDLRQARPSWQVNYDDGTHIYLDADTGSLLAIRTQFWRAYDFMWGLHILDLKSRENFHHPLLIGFAAISFLSLILAFWILIFRQYRKGRKSPIARRK